MKDFQDKVAVVTGAASGIGRGMAEKFAAEGMKVVLADVEEEPLRAVESELRGRDARVLAVLTDVSQSAQVEELARRAFDEFGAVHVLCNNAGVGGGGGRVWELTENDWRWTLGVNLWGVIHGLRAFVPRMIAQQSEGHIVNTASVFGLYSGGPAPYGVSKFGVTRISESLFYDLKEAGSSLRCSVLCPGMIATRITESGRNRPGALQNEQDAATRRQMEDQSRAVTAIFQERGMPPAQVGDIVVEAIRAERFYILTHPDAVKGQVRARMEAILDEGDPSALARQGGLL